MKGKFLKLISVAVVMSIVGKMLGFLREILIASTYGVSEIYDAFLIAMIIPSIVTALGSSILPSILPVISNDIKSKNYKDINELISIFVNIIAIITISTLILAMIFNDNILKIVYSGNNIYIVNDIKKLLIYLVPMTFISITSSILGSLLYAYSFTMIPMVSDLAFSIVGIVLIPILGDPNNIWPLVLTLYVSNIIRLSIQYLYLRVKCNFKYVFKLDFKNPSIQRILKLSLPIMLGSLSLNINVMIDRRFASELEVGSVTALSYGDKVNMLILSIFIYVLTAVIYPWIVNNNKSGINEIDSTIVFGLKFISLIFGFITIIALTLDKEIITILFQRGEFDILATEKTSKALFFYSLGMIPYAMYHFLLKIYYSTEKSRLSGLIGLIGIILNVLLNYLLVKIIGFAGLALSTSIVGLFNFIVLITYFIVSKKLKSFSDVFLHFMKLVIVIIGVMFVSLNLIQPAIYSMNIITIFEFVIISLLNLLMYILCIILFFKNQLIMENIKLTS